MAGDRESIRVCLTLCLFVSLIKFWLNHVCIVYILNWCYSVSTIFVFGSQLHLAHLRQKSPPGWTRMASLVLLVLSEIDGGWPLTICHWNFLRITWCKQIHWSGLLDMTYAVILGLSLVTGVSLSFSERVRLKYYIVLLYFSRACEK